MVTPELEGARLPNLSGAELEKLLQESTEPVLVDLWSEACGPCKAMAPMLGALAHEIPDVRMVAVNLDEQPLVMGMLEVTTLPTIVLFADGREAGRLLGAQSRLDVLAAIEEIRA